ncbi:MAG: hypothetical protein L3J22_07465 [Xanthomonadales bacterium]|nr:hypothetical protein [Xanthomonadales bacterium]
MKKFKTKLKRLLSAIAITFVFTLVANAQPPLFDEWESNMTTWGDHWGVYLQTYEPPLIGMFENNGIYYDAQSIYFKIADYTGQAEPWNAHAQEAERIYRVYLDNALHENGTPWWVQGWRRFSHGILMDAQRTADPISIEGVLRMRDRGAYSNILTFDSATTARMYYERKSREVAYLISAHINAEKFGLSRQEESNPEDRRSIEAFPILP